MVDVPPENPSDLVQIWQAQSYAQRASLPRTRNDLSKHTLVRLSNAPAGRFTEISAGESMILDSPSRIATDDFNNLTALIQRGRGIGILPDFMGEGPGPAGSLVKILPNSAATLFRTTSPTARSALYPRRCRHLLQRRPAMHDKRSLCHGALDGRSPGLSLSYFLQGSSRTPRPNGSKPRWGRRDAESREPASPRYIMPRSSVQVTTRSESPDRTACVAASLGT